MPLEHDARPTEQTIIDELITRYRVEFVPVRLTETMLKKAIIDAREPLREYLRRTGIVEFAAIRQGLDHRLRIPIPLITKDGASSRVGSFYRPDTKLGDPRVWIERLSDSASPGDLLLFGFSNNNIVAIVATGSPRAVADAAAPFLQHRFEERAEIEAAVRRLSERVQPLMGEWTPTRRPGPTGVGYTLETLLGIGANVSRKADVDGVELKAYRRGAVTGPGKLVSLFSQVPEWVHEGRGRGLLDRYGYDDERRNRRALYCTITSKTNTLGWRLKLLADESRVGVEHRAEVAMHYSYRTLEDRLLEKHPSTLFVRAQSRGAGRGEEFLYDEIIFCRQPSFASFLDLTQEDFVGLDLTLSLKASGASRDHGYLWRIREAHIPRLFAYRKQLVAPN